MKHENKITLYNPEDQDSWTFSVRELTPVAICFQGSSIQYKYRTPILLQVPWPGLFGSLQEQDSCQTITNMNSEQPLLGVSGTASTPLERAIIGE